MRPQLTLSLLTTPVYSYKFPDGQTPAERFQVRVERRSPDECWPYLGRPRSADSPYGVLVVSGHAFPAHRVALVLAGTNVPDDLDVLHSCDYPPCCNPRHLRVGTRRENTQDAIDRDRLARGARIGMAKLTDAQVLSLRRDYSAGVPITAIAARFGVSRGIVSSIAIGVLWPHVGEWSPRRGQVHGESVHTARLTRDQVLSLRMDWDKGTSMRALARTYGVAKSTVAAIVHRTTWKDVP